MNEVHIEKLRFLAGWLVTSLGIGLFIAMVPASIYALFEADFYGTGVGLLVCVFAFQLIEMGYYLGTGREFPLAISAARPLLGKAARYEANRQPPQN